MRLHVLQHEEEGPGEIASWANRRGLDIAFTHFDRNDQEPELSDIRLLAVMGGSPNIYQYRLHPWLRREKAFLDKAIRAGCPVIGVCLGAQLLADRLGAKVYQASDHEVGWHPIRFKNRNHPDVPPGLPESMTVLHWHGDTFDLPYGATRFAETDLCPNQGFVFGNKILALQFHLEAGPAEIPAFVADHPRREGPWIQTPEQVLAGADHVIQTRPILFGMLDRLVGSEV
jgi:GMP synthase (glutamine-hydrolysing)